MIKLIKVNTKVWGNWDGTNYRTTLKVDTKVNTTGYERNGYSYINSPSVGWVLTANLKDEVIVPPPPAPEPNTLNLWRTRFAGEIQSAGYKPSGINFGSFAIIWLMEQNRAIQKPEGWNLSDSTCAGIKLLNDNISTKWNWLLDQQGTRRILNQDSEEMYPVHLTVPCVSAGNIVNVLEETALYCRIQTVQHDLPFPDNLKEIPHLCHVWYAYKTDGTIYRPVGGVLWPLLARSTSAWVQKAALAKL